MGFASRRYQSLQGRSVESRGFAVGESGLECRARRRRTPCTVRLQTTDAALCVRIRPWSAPGGIRLGHGKDPAVAAARSRERREPPSRTRGRAGPLAIGLTSLARAFRPDFPAALRLTAIRSRAAAPRIRLNRASVPGRSELTSAIGNGLSDGLHQALANRFVDDLRCVEPIALVSSEPTANGAHGGESAFLGLMGWIRVARPGASCRLDQ